MDLPSFLKNYRRRHPEEAETVDRFEKTLASAQGERLKEGERADFGHLTASAFVVDAARKKALLIYHKKLQRWLQPGGHIEAGETALEAARREVLEECGLENPKLLEAEPFDIDVHEIPLGKDPAHLHFDLRFLLEAPEDESQGELEARWIPLENLKELTDEESVLRMARKTK